jgi:hypothetical protein
MRARLSLGLQSNLQITPGRQFREKRTRARGRSILCGPGLRSPAFTASNGHIRWQSL